MIDIIAKALFLSDDLMVCDVRQTLFRQNMVRLHVSQLDHVWWSLREMFCIGTKVKGFAAVQIRIILSSQEDDRVNLSYAFLKIVKFRPWKHDRYSRQFGKAATIGGVAADCKSVPTW